jgi:hypothetical protein
VLRSFPNFASDLFLFVIPMDFFGVCKFQKKTKHTLILLRSAWIKLERELQLPDLRLVLCRLHCMCSLLALRYKWPKFARFRRKKFPDRQILMTTSSR